MKFAAECPPLALGGRDGPHALSPLSGEHRKCFRAWAHTVLGDISVFHRVQPSEKTVDPEGDGDER
jgi:hypothetical protein